MNATNFATNKDFRKTVDIRQKIRIGHKGKKIYLPDENFTYGLPNRPSTPIKDVLSNAYGNREENIIRKEYGRYIREKSARVYGAPKVEVRYYNPQIEEMKKKEEQKKRFNLNGYVIKDEQPMYKMKMFKGIPSKVSQGIRQFKTFYPKNGNKMRLEDDGVDRMINKVEGELGEDQQNEGNYQQPAY